MKRITANRIRRAIGEPSYSRGEKYFERGRVQNVHFEADSKVIGLVLGSNSQVYAVSAKFRSDASAFSLEGRCSCPVGYNCKHVAAVLLAAANSMADGIGDDGAATSVAVSHEVSRWLDLWPKKLGTPLEVRPPGLPSPGQDHLFYVIHRDTTYGMRVSPYRAYLKKDGTIGSNFRSFDRRSTWTRRNLTVQDAGLIGKLDFFSDYGFDSSYDWPEGDALVELLREIVETGRARAHEIDGEALCWRPPRRCKLVWSV